MAKRVHGENIYIMLSADKRGMQWEDTCKATSIEAAIEAFEYGPGGIENHWENMVDRKIIDAALPFDPENAVFKAHIAYHARKFFGLEEGEDPYDEGNYIDGDSNSAYVIVEVTSSGDVSCYPEI